jgi:hypothetical protein
MNRPLQKLRDVTASKLYPAYQRDKEAFSSGASEEAGHRAFGLRFREWASGWEPDKKREWILEQLRLATRRACIGTDYYRNVFASIGFDPFADFTFDDFAKLPVLERDDISAHRPQLLSTECRRRRCEGNRPAAQPASPRKSGSARKRERLASQCVRFRVQEAGPQVGEPGGVSLGTSS